MPEDDDLNKRNFYINSIYKNHDYNKIQLRRKFSRKDVCPHCGDKSIIRHGYHNNKQRYLCKNCRKTFSESTNTLVYYSKKDKTIWEKYINLMYENLTLSECAEKLHINITTAFLWRHKILNAIKDYYIDEKLNGYIEIRKLIISEKNKGTKRNLEKSHRKIWIYSSADEENNIVTCPTCNNYWDTKNFYKLIYTKIDKEAFVASFSDRYVQNIMSFHNQGKKGIYKPETRVGINIFLKKYNEIILKCHGIASKYLRHYLNMAKIFSTKKVQDKKELFSKIWMLISYIRRKDFVKVSCI